jgi:hypothetical protein
MAGMKELKEFKNRLGEVKEDRSEASDLRGQV